MRKQWWHNPKTANLEFILRLTATTSDSNGIWRAQFKLTSVPVLLNVVTFFSLIVVLTPNNSFWIVPVLHSVIDTIPCISVIFIISINVIKRRYRTQCALYFMQCENFTYSYFKV